MPSEPQKAPAVLVCRIAWMREYNGRTATDVPRGGGAYVDEHGWGHEMFNFRNEGAGYFGFVQPKGEGINTARLTGVSDATEAKGITVLWVATHPTEGHTRVVGWYVDAVAYAEGQKPVGLNRKLPDGKHAWFFVKAPKARLLGLAERHFVVPRGKGGMGQSNVWYPGEQWASELLKLVDAGPATAPPATAKGSYIPHLQDTEKRLRIERVAVEATAAHYAALEYTVTDVANQNLGWDLECRKGSALLRVEVKGTSATWPTVCVEVTPNEYSKMTSSEVRDSYRLAVVCVADDACSLVVFSWSDETARWVAETGAATLSVKPITAARLQVVAD